MPIQTKEWSTKLSSKTHTTLLALKDATFYKLAVIFFSAFVGTLPYILLCRSGGN